MFGLAARLAMQNALGFTSSCPVAYFADRSKTTDLSDDWQVLQPGSGVFQKGAPHPLAKLLIRPVSRPSD